MTYPSAPRLPPQPSDEWSDRVRSALSADRGDQPSLGELNIFATLVRHPELFRVWMPFAGYLLSDLRLPFADRELVILRTGYNCRSPYEWGQHARLAASGGVGREVIDRIPAGPQAPEWTERQALLLRASDELHAGSRISDETWRSLAEHLHEEELIELPMLVGQYHLVAFTLAALGVQPEPGLEPLPDA